MPYKVEKNTRACPANKPWAVTTTSGPNAGHVHGCFVSQEAAQKQQRALYANTSESELPNVTIDSVERSRVLREAATADSFQSNGKTIRFTGLTVIQEALDLYQYIEHDYNGSDSIDAKRLEQIIQVLYAGSPLSMDDWNVLDDIKNKVGDGFEQWKARGRDGQDAILPSGSGRLVESAGTLSRSELSSIKEILAVRESAPSPPPNLRKADTSSQQSPIPECGTCLMFNNGRCWGYGNVHVDADWLCDSWSEAPDWRGQVMEASMIEAATSDVISILRKSL